MPPTSFDSRRGATLAELLVTLAIVAVLAGFVVVRIARLRDAAAVRGATVELEQALALARESAVAWRATVSVRVDSLRGRLDVRRGGALLRTRDLLGEYGVRLAGTRDSVVYDARGLGRGAANATFVVRRGVTADTIVVSRLGRVRR